MHERAFECGTVPRKTTADHHIVTGDGAQPCDKLAPVDKEAIRQHEDALEIWSHERFSQLLAGMKRAFLALHNGIRYRHIAVHELQRKRRADLIADIIADNLPACTRYAQTLQGLPKTWSRQPMPEASSAQQAAIRTALEGLGALGDKRVQAAE